MAELQGPANVELYEGLLMLQHRGQDSAGMVTTDGECFHEHKENGLVRDVFGSQNIINTLQGTPPPPPAYDDANRKRSNAELFAAPFPPGMSCNSQHVANYQGLPHPNQIGCILRDSPTHPPPRPH